MTGALRGLLGGLFLRGKISQALMFLVDRRLGRISAKIAQLAERFAAGGLRVSVPREAVAAARVRTLSHPRPAPIWPRKAVWLVAMEGYRAAGHGLQFRHLLGHPDMVALLTACPQAARIMLPMCRMLGVETSLLYPGALPKVIVEKPIEPKPKRVRRRLPPIDWGRIPLPRGMLSAARRAGFKPVG